MHARAVLTAAVTAAAITALLPATAQAANVRELVDRSLFDGTPERSASALRLAGPTAGPLGGAMDLVVSAIDGTLPVANGSCEPAGVTAVVTVEPGEVLTVTTTGQACAHIVDGSLEVVAGFGRKQVTYEGTKHRKARLVGEGLVSAADRSFGGLASFSGTFRW